MCKGPIASAAQASLGFRNLEFGSLFGDDNVTLRPNSKGEPQNISVHAGDDRLLLHRTIEKIRRVCFWFLWAAQPLEFLPRPGLSGSDVSSSRERTAVASENGDKRR
jgi:hypothetical protein